MRSSGSGKKQNFFWRHFNGIAMAAIVLIPTIYTTSVSYTHLRAHET